MNKTKIIRISYAPLFISCILSYISAMSHYIDKATSLYNIDLSNDAMQFILSFILYFMINFILFMFIAFLLKMVFSTEKISQIVLYSSLAIIITIFSLFINNMSILICKFNLFGIPYN
jgi:uncharacterized membrane protein